MFANKNKTQNKKDQVNNEQELVSKVNSDLLVRNMPSHARLSAAKFPATHKSFQTGDNVLSTMAPAKNNHQTVGILIISGGFILIAALVYLSYVFIIKPPVKTSSTPVQNNIAAKPSVLDIPKATTTEQIISVDASQIATVTPSVIEIASSSASTTMPEEGSTLSGANLPPLIDTDNDGLNDEEEAVLGTNPNLADSNSNTYNDLVEITNNYDPAGSGKLNTNKNLTIYHDTALGYSLLYPKAWTASSLSNDSIIIFTAPDDSIIQITVQDNPDKQNISGWYTSSFPDDTLTNDKLKTAATWDGVMGSDNMNFYLMDKKKQNIFIVSYIPAVTDRIAYPNIFKLMINSLTLK